jgi:ferritin-like metal-binding protein YciE
MSSRLESLLNDQLKELYAAEVHLSKGMPRLLEGVYSSELKTLLEEYQEQCEAHEKSILKLLKQQSTTLHAPHCKAVDALVKRALEISQARGDATLLDVELLSVFCQIGSYTKCAYELARTVSETVNDSEALKVLDAHMRDEVIIEQSCTVLFEDMIDSMYAEGVRRTEASTQQAGEAPIG